LVSTATIGRFVSVGRTSLRCRSSAAVHDREEIAAALDAAAGCAVTGGGSLLPMADVIRLASHAHHYLSVYDNHAGVPLYLGRAKRCASPGQRIVLHDRDRGCTFPGCTVPGYGTQVHHIVNWTRTAKPTSTSKCWPAVGTTATPNEAGPSSSKTASCNGSRQS
jgi:hypothetical protein